MIRRIVFIVVIICFGVTAQAQQIPKLKMADVVKLFNTKSDTIYVVNFWATFCKPCVAEIPNFIKIANQYKKQKVKLLLVSLDLPSFYPKRIATFATKNNFTTNLAWLDETDADYFCPMIDKDWSGAIPATIIVNNKTGYKKFFEAEMKGEEFEKEVKKAIGSVNTPMTTTKFFMPMDAVVSVNYFDPKSAACLPTFSTTFKSNDSTVYAVTEGEVSTVVFVENMNAVIIKKDSLFYIYSNLKSVLIKRGDSVKADQIIGYASGDLDSVIPKLEFYVSNEYGPIVLSKNNFKCRGNKSIYFTPMLGMEPE